MASANLDEGKWIRPSSLIAEAIEALFLMLFARACAGCGIGCLAADISWDVHNLFSLSPCCRVYYRHTIARNWATAIRRFFDQVALAFPESIVC